MAYKTLHQTEDPMTVSELIDELSKFRQDVYVAVDWAAVYRIEEFEGRVHIG